MLLDVIHGAWRDEIAARGGDLEQFEQALEELEGGSVQQQARRAARANEQNRNFRRMNAARFYLDRQLQPEHRRQVRREVGDGNGG